MTAWADFISLEDDETLRSAQRIDGMTEVENEK